MTNQESIEDIRSCIGCGIYEETANIAISALKKQIPKKVIKVKPYGSKCPVCDCYFDSRAWKSAYCGKCGQKIDWSE